MPDTQNLKLPEFIYSHEQIGLYLLQLDHYKSHILQREAKANRDLGSEIEKGGRMSPELEEYLQEISSSNISYDTIEKVYEFLTTVRSKAPRLHLTLASRPRESTKKEIVSWARRNIHEWALVSFNYDRSIVGGVVVRTRNKIFDLSYAKKLKEPKTSIASLLLAGPQNTNGGKE